MLLPARIFRRRPRLAVLVLIGLVVYVVHRNRVAFEDLPKQWTADPVGWTHHGRGRGRERHKLLADVANTTLGFQEIFVVNLPSRTDRSDAIALAASLTNLKLTFSPGIDSQTVQDRVLPADSAGQPIPAGNKGSWRAHMNVLRRIIEQNLTTALVMEDDIDWDVRLKEQMTSFALAAQAYGQPQRVQGSGTGRSLAQLHRPLFDKAPRSIPDFGGATLMRKGQQPSGPAEEQSSDHAHVYRLIVAASDAKGYTQKKHDVPLASAPEYEWATTSPYGDDWDVLWLGHCGTEFPASPPSFTKRPDTIGGTQSGGPSSAPAQLSLLRVIMADDVTVPQPADLRPHPFALPDQIGKQYPPHTRVVHTASGTLCTQTYAVSQRGARKLLYQFGLASFTTGFDLMLRDWCDGMYRQGPGTTPRRRRAATTTGGGQLAGDDGAEEPLPQCLTVQPPLFSHFLVAKETSSDIGAQGGGFLHKTGSQYIRLSVQQNLRRLANGVGLSGLKDQWPEESGGHHDGG
ncbi:hypothetical protein SPBR_08388 [Sporothrix brasiliensis 5110]|uniref:Glycosyl transferase family 25 domain-containing protein n=1 Tax=Sporothrix brasiliensis 5110 TaxID=1398154 RepID=A0A0C2IC78_9PEZI|nr:uncharacterized protein SPBR_08388 [Sporothrix brasiliensis 5110]KIH86906.1 hypothetical protein SPBR_08388 [Sporothrix brasiliensis 5110]